MIHKMLSNANIPEKEDNDLKTEWLISRHFLFRSKGIKDFEHRLNKDLNNDELSVISLPKSKISEKESVFDVLFRDRANSNFSFHMSDIHAQKNLNTMSTIHEETTIFNSSMVELMAMFDLKKVYLNDGLFLVSSEYFLEPDEHEGVAFPISIRIEDLKSHMDPNRILNFFKSSVLVVLKGKTSLVHIKTYPNRAYYGIKAHIKVQEAFQVQCLIGVTNDPTFTHEIFHDYQLNEVTFSFSYRTRIA